MSSILKTPLQCRYTAKEISKKKVTNTTENWIGYEIILKKYPDGYQNGTNRKEHYKMCMN